MITFMHATSTHMYTHTHTCMAYIHTYTSMLYSHQYANVHIHPSIHVYLHICAHSWHKHMHTITHPHTCIFMYAHMHSICTYIHLLIHINSYIYIHVHKDACSHMHTCMAHMHIHMYTHTHKQNVKMRLYENLLIPFFQILCSFVLKNKSSSFDSKMTLCMTSEPHSTYPSKICFFSDSDAVIIKHIPYPKS